MEKIVQWFHKMMGRGDPDCQDPNKAVAGLQMTDRRPAPDGWSTLENVR